MNKLKPLLRDLVDLIKAAFRWDFFTLLFLARRDFRRVLDLGRVTALAVNFLVVLFSLVILFDLDFLFGNDCKQTEQINSKDDSFPSNGMADGIFCNSNPDDGLKDCRAECFSL
ncbi:hypothetical protein T11_2247 [Trichinella zimbabwensis]|uniref:Uncharacterized protein n=1 Tax=Trichinella zimbabwensis TaxID=268475 RepID=A0A0V1H8Q6_9BILA|nr:hypothetical protein T11_3232 [Trichinella zimbabwensis]KRZ06698.1 hypothetical protein T11_2247 [Trichinella zimbabwensis]